MKRILWLAGFCALAILILLFAGSLRYGGAAGLVQRVRAELAERRPADHPVLVPTPLPTPTADVVAAAKPTQSPTKQKRPATATASPSPVALPTLSPTPSPSPPRSSPSPTSTPPPSPTPSPAPPPTLALSGFRHAWQTWNNCGPATLSMQLSYYGSPLTQEDIRKVLRHHPDDKNVNLDELAAFARGQGLQASARVDGSPEQVRQWLNNGIPVLVETWLEPEPNDGMGHYRLLTGYDDAAQEWIAYDSYVATGISRDAPYQGIRLPYAEVAELWRVFNRAYMIVYTDAQAPVAETIMANSGDEGAMWQGALQTAQDEIAANPDDAFAWFNQGSALVALGQPAEAAVAFDRARILGLPWRMLWYQFGPFQAYSEVGRHEEVLALVDATLRTTNTIEELHYWRGRALQALGDPAAARQAFQRALELNPSYAPAANSLNEIGA